MDVKNQSSSSDLCNFKRTKIIATIGPTTNSYELILKIIEAGANGLRLNFSHGTYEERDQQIKWIRKASKKSGKPISIIQDLQGPKIRLGDFDGIINVLKGQTLKFRFGADYIREGAIPVQYDISQRVKRGERLYLFDGKVKSTVSSVKDGVVYSTAENDGILIARKGINLPDTNFAGDIITAKDKKDIIYGSTQDIDYVALSFVHNAEDVNELRKLLQNLGSEAKIIAKIETKSATENLEEIVDSSDAVMIARGDLAVEVLPEQVPVLQRKIVGLGLKYGKPTIVATQMLASMTENSDPTRAEVSDIATAVIIGADTVMLSDETANGKYPVESVCVMKRVILYTQANSPLVAVYAEEPIDAHISQGAISAAIINLANAIDATAIVAETKSGATAFRIAARRPKIVVLAVTSSQKVANQLAILYGTMSFVRKDNHYQAQQLTELLCKKSLLHKGDIVVTASGRYPGVVGTTDTIKVRVME